MAAYDLKPIWTAVLDIYSEFARICERHNLRMFVAYGTAIGAMRHQGFIPWDDDFDVFMPRPDYERFAKLAETELPRHLKWVSFENDDSYTLSFGKVKETRGDVLSRVQKASGLDLKQGLFIDVFQLDGMPTTRMRQMLWAVQRSVLRRSQNAVLSGISFSRLGWWLIGKCLGISKNRRDCARNLQRWVSKIPFDEAEFVAPALSSMPFPRYIFPRAWFDDYRKVPFENISVRVPVGVEEYLNQSYGDYREFPPENLRKPMHQQ